jgi:hypothetical protein
MRGIAPRIACLTSNRSECPVGLFLRSHVFLCRGKRHWVILDVNRDKYHCVDRREFEVLGRLLEGWKEPLDTSGHERAAGSEVADELANNLLSLDILSERSAGTKDALPTDYPLPTAAIDPNSSVPSRRSACIHAWTFFASCARASRELRQQPFQLTVEAVRARKSYNASTCAGATDFERARSLVSVFDRLRWYYPRSYLCLFDSLALIHFLANFQVFPDWVFGVSSDPFEAHCSVHLGGVVLNDTVERIPALIPIMCV